MTRLNRRTTMKLFGGGAIAAATTGLVSLPAAAQAVDPVVLSKYENFKRGNIHSLDPKTRGLVVVWQDLGRVKMKAADTVVKDANANGGNAYPELKEGQTVDIHWYDYVDFMIAKGSPATLAKAKAMVAQGARFEGFPGSDHQAKLFMMEGTITRLDPATYTMWIVFASGGEPDKGVPATGEVVQLPQVRSPEGQAAFATLKPGDLVDTVFSVQTAVRIRIIR
jgi:hypothetical protein